MLRCRYCGAEQAAPDIETRRRALAQRAREQEARQFESQLQQQVLKQQRSTQRTARWMMLPGLIIGMVCMAAAMVPILKMSFGSLFASTWDGTSAFDCDGNEEKRLSGVSANLAGTAVYARANCRLTIEDCHINASTAIDASGNAHVIIKGGSLDGAIEVSGNASVDNRGGRVNGKVHRLHNARVTGIP